MRRQPLLIDALTHPHSVATRSASEWDVLIRQARRANLLGRLAHVLAESKAVIAAASVHLLAAKVITDRQRVAIRWEVECIRRALTPTGVPFVLLKGAAYVMANLPVSEGRMFSDIDIIVSRDTVPAVESALMMNGWIGSHHDAYTQRYYRTWMHEIPPLQHLRRGTVIDVHHAILPITARVRADSSAMRAAARPVPGEGGCLVFKPVDMVLHSACHLFHEGEFDNGLRDLFDLDSLLRHFASTPGFWAQLPERALELGLQRPLYYALRYVTSILETPVPEAVIEAARGGAPNFLLRPLMDFCFSRTLRCHHPTCSDRWAPLARWLLYLRAHWLRMPFFLLLIHLLRKALVSSEGTERHRIARDDAVAPEAEG